jgi:hypothetical protein
LQHRPRHLAVTVLPLALLTFPAQAAPPGCASFYYFSPGKRVETTTRDERGKVKSREEMIVRSARANASSARASLETRTDDQRAGDAAATSEASCKDGELLLDLSSSLPAQKEKLSARQPVLLRYPAAMRVGQSLESRVDFNLDGQAKGKAMKVGFDLSDRRVTDRRMIDTPAGTQPAFVIRSVLNVSFRVVGIAIPMRYDLVEYFVPGLGVMRTEAVQKGKVVERSDVRFLD